MRERECIGERERERECIGVRERERGGEREMGKVRVSEREREDGVYFAYVFLPEGTSAADHVLVASFLSFCLTYVNFAAKALANCFYTDETLNKGETSESFIM